MKTGKIEANLVELNDDFKLSYLPELIAQKQERAEKAVLVDADVALYQAEYERLYRELEEAAQKSHLPETPSAQAALNNLLVRLRLGAGNELDSSRIHLSHE